MISLMACGLGRTLEVGHPGGRKDSGGVQGVGDSPGRCDQKDPWYLSTGSQPRGRM